MLAPGTERPVLTSNAFEAIDHTWSAAPFRSPSAAHPRGSILIAGTHRELGERPRLVEIDLATWVVVHEVAVPTTGSFVGVAASDRGALVVVNEPDTDADAGDAVFVFDGDLTLKRSLRVRGSGTAAAAKDGIAVIATHLPGSRGGELRVVELPSGAQIGSTNVREPLMDEWVPRAQVLIHDDAVWSLSRGEGSYVLRAFSRDLKQVLASSKLSGAASVKSGPDGHPGPHYGDGRLAASPDGVLVLREGLIQSHGLHADRITSGLPATFRGEAPPAIDAGSGRVLMPTGELASSLDAKRADPVVVFRRGVWKWSSDGTHPIEYDSPVAAFFISGQGVIVTQNPGLRVSVLEWSAAARPDGGP